MIACARRSAREPQLPLVLIRSISFPFLAGLAAALAANAAAAHPGMEPTFGPEPLQIESVLVELRAQNQSLRAARTRLDAAREKLPQAAAWDDPRVGVDFERTNRRLDSYHDAEWSISQTLPLTGKIPRRKQAVAAEISAAEALVRQTELDLEMRARILCYGLADVETQLAINTRNQSLLHQILEITRAKYESGRLRQADVLMAETELTKLSETRVDLLRAYGEAQTALNALLNRAPATPLGHATLPDFAPREASLESAVAHALAHRPQLAAAGSRVAAAEARVALAERERLPDPELRLEARQFNGTALYNVREYDTGIFISLPWANGAKYRAAIREAKKNALAEQHEHAALETETTAMVRDAWQRRASFRHHVELFRDRLLPLARQTVDATRASYEAGNATLPELLAAQRTAQET